MRLVKPSIEFLWMTANPLEAIERAGRTCYKSEGKIGMVTCSNCKGTRKDDDPHSMRVFDCEECGGKGEVHSSVLFVRMLLKRGHHAMVEHATFSCRFICDRGVTHEIVRHRLFSYAQESTRYCDYRGGVAIIIPPWLNLREGEYKILADFKEQVNLMSPTGYWLQHKFCCESSYVHLRNSGWSPQKARSELPNALKTEIVITGNLRQWIHFFKLRTTEGAHPQMQEIACLALKDIRKRIPVIYDKENIERWL